MFIVELGALKFTYDSTMCVSVNDVNIVKVDVEFRNIIIRTETKYFKSTSWRIDVHVTLGSQNYPLFV